MQSGRVLPIIRQFFTSPVSTKSATDRDSGNSQQQQKQEREPTDEETKRAFEHLLQQEEFKLQGLVAEMRLIEGRSCIVVLDKNGNQLRVIKGPAVLKLLETSVLGKNGHYLGRILDRRI